MPKQKNSNDQRKSNFSWHIALFAALPIGLFIGGFSIPLLWIAQTAGWGFSLGLLTLIIAAFLLQRWISKKPHFRELPSSTRWGNSFYQLFSMSLFGVPTFDEGIASKQLNKSAFSRQIWKHHLPFVVIGFFSSHLIWRVI